MAERRITFEKIGNVRDLGGLRTTQGRVIASRLLIRSANLAEAEAIRDIFLAREAYLDAAFSAMDAQYADADAFLHDGLHIPQKLLEQFQKSVL